MVKSPFKHQVDGRLLDSSYIMIDNALFLLGLSLTENPTCIIDEKTQYITDQTFADVYDGQWLVEVEDKISIRTLIRIPVRKVRVSGVGMAFDCALEDISVLGRFVMAIE